MSVASRNPIPGAALHAPLKCISDGVIHCANKRTEDADSLVFEHQRDAKKPTAIEDFRCPYRDAGCKKGAFLYPRKIKLEPHLEAGYRIHYHQGIDISGIDGITQIVSVVNGKVREVWHEGVRGYGGYGLFVELESADSGETLYYLHAHCADILVEKGEQVTVGKAIAIVGCTEFETDYGKKLELDYCEALKEWRLRGAPDPAPERKTGPFTDAAGKTILNKKGKPFIKDWTSPHLHFEISKHPFGSKHSAVPVEVDVDDTKMIRVDRDIEGNHKDFTEDPLEVLAKLGGGVTDVTPTLYFPTGEVVAPQAIEAMHERVEHQEQGGYFPVGSNNFWHGGVHLFGSQGKPLVVPFAGTIVALRLDERPERAYREFGSVNFILLKHEIPDSLAEKLAPIPLSPKDKQGSQQPPKQVKVGKGGGNDGAYVLDVKRMLHAICPAGASEPFYAPLAHEELESEETTPTLIEAIGKFQQHVIDQSKKKKWKVNHAIVIPGPFWNELRSRALKPPPTEDGEGASSSPSQGGAQAVKTLYSLFMHLEAATIDGERAKEVPWLARVKLQPSEEDKAAAAKAERQDEDADRQEGVHTMEGDVGAAGRPGRDNLPADVRWVKKRLLRFGYYKGAEDDTFDPALSSAISDFQKQHVKKKNGEAVTPDGVVSKNGNTCSHLKKTRKELDLQERKASRIDAEFLKQARAVGKVEEQDVVNVVSGLSVPVSAGEVLWTTGVGPLAEDGSSAPLTHWEMFSEESLMLTWHMLQDPSKDLKIDVTPDLVTDIEKIEELEDDEKKLSANEVATYFSAGRGKHLRHYQCQFHHEAAFTPAQLEAAAAKAGDDFPEWLKTNGAPYLWWQAAKAVLPSSPVVWHYNPIEALAELARASGLFEGTLTVIVTRSERPVSAVKVTLTSPGQASQHARTDEAGRAVFEKLVPGQYRAVVEDASKHQTRKEEGAVSLALGQPAEVKIALHPTFNWDS